MNIAVFLIIIGISIFLFVIITSLLRERNLRNELAELRDSNSVNEKNYQSKIVEMEQQRNLVVQQMLLNWQNDEIDKIKKQQMEIAQKEAKVKLEMWIIENEYVIRQDAIQRSQSSIIGKVTEHLIPYMPIFTFNPKDARFLGSPIDLLIFDGLENGYLEEIVFLEVKTGKFARMSSRQKQIRDAIVDGRVRWAEMRVSRNDLEK